jgi:hypothetical protein
MDGNMQIKDDAKLLKDIAKLILEYEDPTGWNSSNDVAAEITIGFGRETEKTYFFNGESFVECDVECDR